MKGLRTTLRLCSRALLLQDDAYAAMRELPSPFTKGLMLVLVVGIAVSAVGLVGEILEWATLPDLGDLKAVVLQRLRQMDWYVQESRNSPKFEAIFRQGYDTGWRILPYLFGAPHPVGAAVKVIVTPLWLGGSWLLFGLVAFVLARVLGGGASLSQTLGCTALAIGPQLLALARILPYVEIGGVIAVWTLLCNYLALRNAHRLSSGRAFWATSLSLVLLILLGLGLVGGVGAGLELIVSGGG
jgi:hypothetical protein